MPVGPMSMDMPENIENKYFELKYSWDYRPNSNYLLSSVTSQDTMTCQNNATTYAHTEGMSTHSFTQAWAHRPDTDRLCIHFSFFESFLIWSCTEQSS